MAEENEAASSEPKSQPTRNRGCSSNALAIVGVFVSVVYLSNLSMGVFEIPDNLPFVGNLDEVFFSGVLFASLARLGINLPMGQRTVYVDRHGGSERGIASSDDK